MDFLGDLLVGRTLLIESHKYLHIETFNLPSYVREKRIYGPESFPFSRINDCPIFQKFSTSKTTDWRGSLNYMDFIFYVAKGRKKNPLNFVY